MKLDVRKLCAVFVLLQVADFLTTFRAMHLGGVELNPLVRLFMTGSPLQGLIVAKLVSLGIGAVCVLSNRHRALWWSNLAFFGIVAWNVSMLARMT